MASEHPQAWLHRSIRVKLGNWNRKWGGGQPCFQLGKCQSLQPHLLKYNSDIFTTSQDSDKELVSLSLSLYPSGWLSMVRRTGWRCRTWPSCSAPRFSSQRRSRPTSPCSWSFRTRSSSSSSTSLRTCSTQDDPRQPLPSPYYARSAIRSSMNTHSANTNLAAWHCG